MKNRIDFDDSFRNFLETRPEAKGEAGFPTAAAAGLQSIAYEVARLERQAECAIARLSDRAPLRLEGEECYGPSDRDRLRDVATLATEAHGYVATAVALREQIRHALRAAFGLATANAYEVYYSREACKARELAREAARFDPSDEATLDEAVLAEVSKPEGASADEIFAALRARFPGDRLKLGQVNRSLARLEGEHEVSGHAITGRGVVFLQANG
jgi:hypothetical protein